MIRVFGAVAITVSVCLASIVTLPAAASVYDPVAARAALQGLGLSASTLTSTTCSISNTMQAQPSTVPVGGPVTISHLAEAECRVHYNTHAVLLVDGSSEMDSEAGESLRALATMLAGGLTDWYPLSLVGVVSFDDQAHRLAPLTADSDVLRAAVRRVGARGRSRADRGLESANRVLGDGQDLADPAYTTDVVFVLTPGRVDGGCHRAVNAAQRLKDRSVLIVTICDATDCNDACLRDIASSPRYVWKRGVGGGFETRSIFERSAAIPNSRWVVTDVIGGDFALVRASIKPEPRAIGAEDEMVVWDVAGPSTGGISLSMVLLPQRVGRLQTSVRASGHVANELGGLARFAFNSPAVDVSAPTDPPPEPTVTPTATHRSPTPHSVYLPRVWNPRSPGIAHPWSIGP